MSDIRERLDRLRRLKPHDEYDNALAEIESLDKAIERRDKRIAELESENRLLRACKEAQKSVPLFSALAEKRERIAKLEAALKSTGGR